jgi:dUTP pyrophosphatase
MKFKLFDPICKPIKKTEGSVGYDLVAREETVVYAHSTAKIPVGIALVLPDHCEAQIRSRSSISEKGLLCPLGTVDTDYRGEVKVLLANITGLSETIRRGDRIAQLVFSVVTDVLSWEEVEDLDVDTERGTGGFGSTGLNDLNTGTDS